MTKNKTVLLNSFRDVFSAQLAKALLESEDIPSIISNENFTQLKPMFSKSIGGVQLFVFEEDFERANEILEAEPLDLDENEEADLS